MANEVDRELSEKYCARFAEIAVKKEFINSDQAKEAIAEQMDDDLAGGEIGIEGVRQGGVESGSIDHVVLELS